MIFHYLEQIACSDHEMSIDEEQLLHQVALSFNLPETKKVKQTKVLQETI